MASELEAPTILCGGVDIDDTIPDIQNENPVTHPFEDRFPRHRHDVLKSKTQKSPGQGQSRDAEGEGGDIEMSYWNEIENIDEVSNPRYHHPDQKNTYLLAVQGRGSYECLCEHDDREKEQ